MSMLRALAAVQMLVFLTANADEDVFAITKAENSATGVTVVMLTQLEDEKTCQDHLRGNKMGLSVSGQNVQIIQSECTLELSPSYASIFQNRPINGVLYFSYTNEIWPTRLVYYGIDPSWLSDEGCNRLKQVYDEKSGDRTCIYGQDTQSAPIDNQTTPIKTQPQLGISTNGTESAPVEKADSAGEIYFQALEYLFGLGAEKNETEAAKLMLKSAQMGYPPAFMDVGEAYQYGKGLPSNATEAVSWYKKAVEAGILRAHSALALAYYQGIGVPKNYFEAAKLLRTLAEVGVPVPDEVLRDQLVIQGRSIEDTDPVMERGSTKALEKLIIGSCLLLGQMYENGEGVEKNPREAVKWFEKAAQNGNAGAQYLLAMKYANGEGLPQSYFDAYIWFSIAAASGDETSAHNRDQVASKLDNESLSAAQRKATELFEGMKDW